jgi:tetratricopeptide (TPR) repeat protein
VDARAPSVEGFRALSILGRGGFAIVWAGLRELDGAPSAIKVGLTSEAVLSQRFRGEADALERVGPPYVPRLYARGGLEDGRPFLVMELVPGQTLAAEIAAQPAPPGLDLVARRADALLAALEVVHAAGLVHRDLKPENVIIAPADSRDGPAGALSSPPGERVVLLDFGLAQASAGGARATQGADDKLTRAGSIVGTPEYMAPEQIRGGADVDARADIYAFGAILFELLTLRPPFVGEARAIEHGHLALRPPRPSELAPVPAAVEELALACLAKEPERRPSSAAWLRRALAEACAKGAAASPAPQRAAASPAPEPPGSALPARLIAEGRQPAIVLFVETSAAAPLVIGAITGRTGLVARQRAGRYVAIFSGRDADQPGKVALSVARELVARHGARAALHLAGVSIRKSARGAPAVYGAAVDRPETWLPASPWSGVALTPEVEPWLADIELTPSPLPGAEPAEDQPPLLGRDDVMAALSASAAAAFDGASSALFTLLGDAGLGKSRLAAEAADLARRRSPDALVLQVRAAQPLPCEATPETAEVLRFALDAPDVPPPPEDIRALCEARLGEAIGAAVWPAVAEALGWRAREGAPLHRDLTRAIAEGLRRRALKAPVAVILDDAQWADDILLDALELATLDGAGAALWAVVAAHPRFEGLRGAWGSRTQRFDKVKLEPLDEEAAGKLAAHLLLPAEYPPADTRRRLARWAAGNPSCLCAIVRSLKRAGLVRRRPFAESYYIENTALESLPISPAWQWIAMRKLEALPPEIAACARLCAVLGVTFTRAELDWVEDAVERAGDAGTPVDAGFGVAVLSDHGIVQRASGERWSFESAVIRDAIYEMLDPTHRAQIHRHALTFFRAQVSAGSAGPEQLESLARHASACGAREEAADAYLKLGDIAFSRHRHAEAERCYTAALELIDAGGAGGAGDAADAADVDRRAHALAGRGRVRYRIHRASEALADLSAARALCDGPFAAELLLEEATALDWMGDYEGSARRVEQARASAASSGGFGPRDPRLAARLLVADGRTRLRQAQVAEAIALLEQGAAMAEAAGDHESRVIALVLLMVELAHAGRGAEAERRAEEVIRLCEEVQDLPHLCIAYMNRVVLWTLKKSLSLAAEDLRRAIALAQEIGNPWLERVATYNVAELLYWSDQRDEALALARRARTLEARFVDRPVPECSLLLARILTVAGQPAEARRLIDWIARACPPDRSAAGPYASFRMLQRILADAPDAPGEALGEPPFSAEDAAALSPENFLFADELLEVLYWRSRDAARRGQKDETSAIRAQAEELLRDHPAWRARFDDIARGLAP